MYDALLASSINRENCRCAILHSKFAMVYGKIGPRTFMVIGINVCAESVDTTGTHCTRLHRTSFNMVRCYAFHTPLLCSLLRECARAHKLDPNVFSHTGCRKPSSHNRNQFKSIRIRYIYLQLHICIALLCSACIHHKKTLHFARVLSISYLQDYWINEKRKYFFHNLLFGRVCVPRGNSTPECAMLNQNVQSWTDILSCFAWTTNCRSKLKWASHCTWNIYAIRTISEIWVGRRGWRCWYCMAQGACGMHRRFCRGTSFVLLFMCAQLPNDGNWMAISSFLHRRHRRRRWRWR